MPGHGRLLIGNLRALGCLAPGRRPKALAPRFCRSNGIFWFPSLALVLVDEHKDAAPYSTRLPLPRTAYRPMTTQPG